MKQGGDIPATKDIHYLVQEFDKMVSESAPTHSSLPILLLSDKSEHKSADAIISGYRARLFAINDFALVPHAYIHESNYQRIATNHKSDYEQMLALLDEIVKQLRASVPKGAKAPRMRNYRLLRTVLDTTISSKDSDDQKDDLRFALYEKWRQRNAWASWLKGSTADIKATDKITFSVGLMARPAMWIYEQRLAHDARLEWFSKEVAKVSGMPVETFLRSAVDFVMISQDDIGPTTVPRLLLMAILKDLDEAMAQRKAKTPFVLLMQSDISGIGKRLLETFGEVLQEIQNHSLLFIGAVAKVPAGLPHVISYKNVVDAANNLESIRQSTTTQRSVTLVAELSTKQNDEDSAAKRWLSSHMLILLPVIATPKRVMARKFVKTAVPLLIVAVLVIALLRFFAPNIFIRCSIAQQSSAVGTEMVGVIGDKPQAPCSFADDLKEKTDAIVAENKEVDDSKEEFATVVFLAPLTVPVKYDGRPADGYNNQSIKWQLDGIVEAQKQLNSKAANDKSDNTVRMKVLVANVGSELRYGPYVVDNYLRSLMDVNSDWNIVGVAGIAQSRSDAQSTISSLSTIASKPAIIGSTATGDKMSEQAYMITANNTRQATIAAHFAHYQPIVGNEKRIARNIFVIKNSDDTLYSQNLADKFEAALASFTNFDGTPAHQSIPIDYTDKVSPKDVAEDLCSNSRSTPFDPAKDMLYFAGRSSEAKSLLSEIDNSCAPGQEPITVLGGSDMGQFRDYEDTPAKDSLYYVGFADAGNVFNKSTNETALKKYVAGNEFKNQSDFARAYDNIFAFGVIANELKQKVADIFTNKALNPASKASTYLSENKISFSGISGFVELGEAQKRPTNRPVLIMKAKAATENNDEIQLVCGTFDSKNIASYWLDAGMQRHDCPVN